MEIKQHSQHSTTDKLDETFWCEIWQLLLSLIAVIERHKLSHYLKFTTKEARDTIKRLRQK